MSAENWLSHGHQQRRDDRPDIDKRGDRPIIALPFAVPPVAVRSLKSASDHHCCDRLH
jgi:hypothetical protein